MTVRAFVFPGQGAQAVGMGAELAAAFPEARYLFQELDDALDKKLSKIIFEGPESDLTLTENAQPALMAVSMAVIRVLEKEVGLDMSKAAAFVAGHSLGEYTALTAAGAFAFADAARLLRIRGEAMQRAVPVGEGAMAALLGVELGQAEKIAAQASAATDGAVCTAANDNGPGQVVISGATRAVERAVELAAEAGAKRAIMLGVSAPFHCAMMAPAADVMAETLADIDIKRPVVPLVANVTAERTDEPDDIRRLLVEQVTSRVRWRECVEYMKANGVETVVEAGAGRVLTGLVKRIDRELEGVSLQLPDDIENFARGL